MVNYHLTDNGPKPCSTIPERCPITAKTGDPHYSTVEEATQAYEQSMSSLTFAKNSAKPKLYAPEKPEIIQPTKEEAEYTLERMRKQIFDNRNKSKKKFNNPLPKSLDSNVLAYGLDGSSMYNLHHPDSDRDLVLIMDSPAKENPIHHIFDDGSDVKIMTGFYIGQSFMKGIPNHVDLLVSGSMKIDKDNPYYSYMNSLRFNKYAYLDTIGQHLRSNLKTAIEKVDDNKKRSDKNFKTILRDNTVAERFMKNGRLRIPFTDDERERFYKSYDKLLKFKNDLMNRENFDKEEVFDKIQNKVIELSRLNA